MKNMMIALALVLASGMAHASMVEEYQANLNKFNLESGTQLGDTYITSGAVDVAPMTNITLTLVHTYKCEAGKLCPAIAYPPIVYQVPFKNVKTGSCGQTIYTGFSDLRNVDGVLTTITVTNNAHNTCKYFVAIPATQVKLNFQGGRTNMNETHYMSGERLTELQ